MAETTTRTSKEKIGGTITTLVRGDEAEAIPTEKTRKGKTAVTATRTNEEAKEVATPNQTSGDDRVEMEPTEGENMASTTPQGATSKERDGEKRKESVERATTNQPV